MQALLNGRNAGTVAAQHFEGVLLDVNLLGHRQNGFAQSPRSAFGFGDGGVLFASGGFAIHGLKAFLFGLACVNTFLCRLGGGNSISGTFSAGSFFFLFGNNLAGFAFNNTGGTLSIQQILFCRVKCLF